MTPRRIMLLDLFKRSDWCRFGIIVAMMVGAAVLELVGLAAVPVFVAVAAAPDTARGYPLVGTVLDAVGAHSAAQILAAGSFLLLAFFALRTGYLLLSYYMQERIIRNREVELSSRLFAAIMNAPYAYHLRRNSADILRTTTQEVSRVISEVLSPLLLTLHHTIIMAAIVTLVVWREPVIGLVTFAYLGVAGIGFLAAANSRMKRYGAMEQDSRRAQYRTVNEGLSVLKELRLYGRLSSFCDRFHRNAEAMAQAQRFRDTARRVTWPTMELVVVAGLLMAAMWMVALRRPVESLLPTLALFTVALARLKGCATEFVSSLSQMRYHRVSVDVVHRDLTEVEALNTRNPTHDQKPAVTPPIFMRQALELQHVTFRYTTERSPVLHDLSLRIDRGASVAFVGPTGSGKSTIVDLVVGLLEPTHGQVLVDGVDIRRNLPCWQGSIGYVPQTIVLLDDTVARNIALGVPDAEIDRAAMDRALEAAQMGPTIAALPEGLATVVGERGVGLSGGQRQRIGIARALYRNPDVLVMDEGTSALDHETERAVVEAVEALKGDRTILMVAHRLTTVMACSRLFYVRDGRIEAAGTYAELVATNADFRRSAAGGDGALNDPR